MPEPASLEDTADRLYDMGTVLLCQVCMDTEQPTRDELLVMLQSGNSKHCNKPMMLTSVERASLLRGMRSEKG